MELVGRTVKKEFPGLGIINGKVKSYDPIDGFFEILYEDGDSEEMDFNEAVEVLEGNLEGCVGGKIEMGSLERRPKKRRLREAISDHDSGNFSDFLVKEGKIEEPKLNKGLIFAGNLETLEKKCSRVGGEVSNNFSINGNVNENSRVNGFDLNVDISMGDDDDCFDGNLKENDLDRLTERTHKKERCFDINLGPEEEIDEFEVMGSNKEEGFKNVDSFVAVEETHLEGGGDNDNGLKPASFSEEVVETQLKDSKGSSDYAIGNACSKEDSSSTVIEGTQPKDCNGLSKHVIGDGFLKKGAFSIEVEEAQLKHGSGVRKRVDGDVLVRTDEDIQSEDRNLSGDFRGVAENHQDRASSKLPDKGASSHKKRGRPSKMSTLTTQIVQCLKSEDRGLGGAPREVASKNTGAYFLLNFGSSDFVTEENHGDRTCSEPPDKGAHSHKKRGRPPKKSKLTTQTDERIQSGYRDLGEDWREVASNDTNAYFHMESGGIGVVITENHADKTCLETPDKKTRSRKKRGRSSGDLDTETLLRRSARRSASTSLNHVSSMDESLASNAASSSHEIDVVLDLNLEGLKEQNDLPPKVELPPSSKNLNIDEIPIIDLFSVYSFLRSFGTILFLSPFSLDAFLEALKDQCPNSLIDCLHFSILHTLKLHMEFLSDEGSQSATNCLRSLDWALLDTVTWPIYMVEYLIIHGSALKPGFELGHLKVFMNDYYKQSPALKIEILRCLCDDVTEAESVRLEINRRTQANGLDMDADRIANIEIKRKRKDQNDDGGGSGSCLTHDAVDETADGNSDECCLCKMDGSLICCDGCPAAYHTRCVGITKDTLPEGEWFCPECIINRDDFQKKSPKSIRGAELLGIDPHGRLYFSTCGYLLVLDSCDPESSYSVYDSKDLNVVIDILKSSDILYGNIVNAISMNAGILGAKGYQASQMEMTCKLLDVNSPISATVLETVPPSEVTEVKPAASPYEISVRNEDFDLQGYKVSDSAIKNDSGLVSTPIRTRNSAAKFETFTEISEVAEVSQICQETGEDCLNGASRNFSKSEKDIEAAPSSDASMMANPGKEALPQVHSEFGYYVNCYTFGQTAASVAQEIRKAVASVKEDFKWSLEDIISTQMKAISKKSTNFCWANVHGLHQNAQQEDCGWCFYCQNPTENEACLFNRTCKKPAFDASKTGIVSFRPKMSRQSHLFAVIGHILSVEERLSGLLSGPWKNASYSKNWRKSILKAPNVASVKHLLLTLEFNLRRLALLPEWLKHVDSVVTMGSASHVMTTPVQVSSSKHVGGRKRAKSAVAESNPSSTPAAKLSTFWWRGGRLSRQLFNYKILPHSLASKGARQAGCTKILDILYPDGSEFAKRFKYIAWRASVEMSTSVAHLAYLVRELDSNIRWDDLENIQDFSHLSKESKKAMKLFKKVTIRRKRIEGTNIKYLLDFGKRRAIPDIVIRHGTMLEVSASERKKYWLEESFVPLHILKAYEEKKIAQTSSKMKPGPADEVAIFLKKASRKSGLLHLLSKAQAPEYYKCGHCNKDVLVRDAVNCLDCEGFFHKRHVRKSGHCSAAESTYQCQHCRDKVPLKTLKKSVKSKLKRKKMQPQKSKKVLISERRKSLPRKVKFVPLQSKKCVGVKKRKQTKSTKQQLKKSKKGICWYRGKRTQVVYAYWLNGVRWTRNSNDARAVKFRDSKLLMPSQHPSANIVMPKCYLCCETSHRSKAIYINCENCQEWVHGEALGITEESSNMILGLRCHKCRNRKPPVCPYLHNAPANEVGLCEGRNGTGI